MADDHISRMMCDVNGLDNKPTGVRIIWGITKTTAKQEYGL
jgi:hypothetical protein